MNQSGFESGFSSLNALIQSCSSGTRAGKIVPGAPVVATLIDASD